MSQRWTETQVRSLAPDNSSLTAARKLAGRWSDDGWTDTALWGLCAGSGSRPYQTIVDLSGPAYRCSCPSRKFPCKHALSLLLRWSRGEVGEQEERADFAASWIDGRTTKAATAATRAPRTDNPATAEQRRARVSAGLEELDTWLTDQVRTGLAQADRSFRAFETIAARMVDAQAPGVAAMLRKLPSLVTTRPDWPEALLSRYARLHLLVAAHRKLDELEPALAASVRTHIGYPTAAEAVRREPAVRDHWMVLGMRLTEEERLYTRRTWLLGRRTQRWALVLEHVYGGPGFSAEIPAPGLMVEADLHYYPGAAPLRALFGERHGAPEPFTTLPPEPEPRPVSDPARVPPSAATTPKTPAVPEPPPTDPHTQPRPVCGPARVSALAAHAPKAQVARAETRAPKGRKPARASAPKTQQTRRNEVASTKQSYAEALGADPWLDSWPVLLRDILPVRADGWYVAESDGSALPLVPLDEPWRLLSVSGGHPVTLCAEWNGERLSPISAFTAGEVNDLGSAGEAQPGAPAALADLASVALLGTARTSADEHRLPAPVASAAARLAGDAAVRLLETTALQQAFATAGLAAATVKPNLDTAADDPRRLLPPAAADRLAGMLRERSDFLTEWFAAADPLNYRAPDRLCGPLLEFAHHNRDLREPALRLAGSRGSWLAAQLPEWHALVRHGVTAPDAPDEVWRLGSPPERRQWLARLRDRDPAAARDELAAGWAKESGPLKAELLAVLGDRLSPSDEGLLETALDDRRADVRRNAAGLLACLPDSAFAQRMIERAEAWIHRGGERERLELVVQVPETLDEATIRDGITDRSVEFSYRWMGAPDTAASRLRQLVAAIPLRYWSDRFGDPGTTTAARIDDRFRQPLFDGWMDAALTQQAPVWARTLFQAGMPSDQAMLRRRELFALVPAADRTRHLLRLDGSWLSEIEALLPAIERPWPRELAQHLILLLFERARAAARRPGAQGTSPAAHRSLLLAASLHLPPDTAREIAALAPRCQDPAWQQAFDRITDDLRHRSIALEELH
ncbi:SWIM zinc finger family protein [Nocardia donostiensis]|nr:DUF5691 domain-containing protein [Nocardia donostiensis]